MCHDIRTAVRFYARDPTLEDAFNVRPIIQESRSWGEEGEEGPSGVQSETKPRQREKKRKKGDSFSTTEEEMEIPYQESGDSYCSEEEQEEEEEEGEKETKLQAYRVMISPYKAEVQWHIIGKKIKETIVRRRPIRNISLQIWQKNYGHNNFFPY